MKIAIIGWGSLIWNPKKLSINKENGWNTEGPLLPIEFSRISKDGRLTLVIDKDALPLKTLFAISNYEKLDEAILDLTVREGCSKSKIGYCNKTEMGLDFEPLNFEFKDNIDVWLKQNPDIDATLWTNLSKRFKDSIGLKYSIDNVIHYLETLDEQIKPLAEEYIRKTPEQINTKIRIEIEKKLNWNKIKL